MLRHLALVFKDYIRLWRVCGFPPATKWLAQVAMKYPECRRARNLQPADEAMGQGPFEVRNGKARALLTGVRVFSGIREIWARDIYFQRGYLTIGPAAVVVDLGANMGNFTSLALGSGPSVRVVAVEPGRDLGEMFRRNVELNGWFDRVLLVPAFVGGVSLMQERMAENPEYGGAKWINQQELLELGGLDHIDFLKCDIEGSEFELLTPESPILQRARQLAIEVHDFAGDRQTFIEMLQSNGWDVGVVKHSADCCVALARRTE
jgi:FkbM family methyltransferase